MLILSVDMSAKVEHWTRDSAIAVANGEQWILYVPARVKRQLRAELKARHGGRNLQYRVFALLIFVAIRGRLREIERIVVDQDYQGSQAEAAIKNFLLQLVRRDQPDAAADFVRFANVKGCAADLLAKRAFDGQLRPNRFVTFEEIERLL